jgi:hypothetical protein
MLRVRILKIFLQQYLPLAADAPQQIASLFDHLIDAGDQMRPIERYE